MSITFKQYLNPDLLEEQILREGGNVLISGQEASSIDLNIHDRATVIKYIKTALTKLNAQFKLEKGLNLWKPSLIADNQIFSGSTKHLFDAAVEEKKLKKFKSTFGDVDLMMDLDLKDQFKDFIDGQKGEKFGELELIGHKPSGDQIITLFKIKEFDMNVQVDFEGVPFDKGEPTEWAHFSHSSSFEDMVHGVKGAFHKLLLTSLMAPKKVDAIEQMKTKQKEIIAGTHTLSVKGMREKYKVTGKDEASGKSIVIDTKSKDFVTDFAEIFKTVFGKVPTDANVKKFWSFKGMLDLINDLMEKKEKEEVVESFIQKLFGTDAQSLYRGDNNRDLEEKMVALRFLSDRLKLDIHDEKLQDMQTAFYLKHK